MTNGGQCTLDIPIKHGKSLNGLLPGNPFIGIRGKKFVDSVVSQKVTSHHMSTKFCTATNTTHYPTRIPQK